jgi:hypothetical protein
VERVKLKRGLSGFWAWAFRTRLARPPMPFWRVVVEAKPAPGDRHWPERAESAVLPIFVWARTIEEAEGLAVLALQQEGLTALTADAGKCPPAAAPKRIPMAVARGEIGFVSQQTAQTQPGGASRRDARA